MASEDKDTIRQYNNNSALSKLDKSPNIVNEVIDEIIKVGNDDFDKFYSKISKNKNQSKFGSNKKSDLLNKKSTNDYIEAGEVPILSPKDFTGKQICEERAIKVFYNQRRHSFSTTELRKRVANKSTL